MHLRISADLECHGMFRDQVHYRDAVVCGVGRSHRSRYIPERAGDNGLRREFGAIFVLRASPPKLISRLDLV
jgi:hypothetical protein